MAGRAHKPIPWLPIDSRLISFSHVRGVAKLFLILEMVISVLMVVGTVILAVLKQQVFVSPAP